MLFLLKDKRGFRREDHVHKMLSYDLDKRKRGSIV